MAAVLARIVTKYVIVPTTPTVTMLTVAVLTDVQKVGKGFPVV